MTVPADGASQVLLLNLLDQIEKLLGDVRDTVTNSGEGGDQQHD